MYKYAFTPKVRTTPLPLLDILHTPKVRSITMRLQVRVDISFHYDGIPATPEPPVIEEEEQEEEAQVRREDKSGGWGKGEGVGTRGRWDEGTRGRGAGKKGEGLEGVWRRRGRGVEEVHVGREEDRKRCGGV